MQFQGMLPKRFMWLLENTMSFMISFQEGLMARLAFMESRQAGY